MRPIPPELLTGSFTRTDARRLGVTSRMLQGKRFTRLHQDVWRATIHVMTEADWVAAARLALPDDAHLTGITRLQRLGLDYGPARPIRFVVDRDHHLALNDVFLHRTKRLPPTDDVGVTVEAAFVAYCARARLIDAINVGDWLLHHHHTTIDAIRTFALSCLWRDGADEAVVLLEHLDGRSRSIKESETRSILRFAGLPAPEVNAAVDVNEQVEVIGDLVYRRWRTVVEYEGSHHQQDRDRYNADLDRYGLMRAAEVRYVQVTKERLARPRTLVGEVYRTLIAGGYDGPPPTFGVRWELLFRGVSVSVGPKRDRTHRSAVS
ncbi:hypothetical protein KM427_24620 [Nocardioides sp. LMS-CY]|uniref:hypothetical protein n=1 Tax=Nocardioides sp. (strain LMS-CY) TaxID=2840457 RepID=UPI001C00350E|nr:hypothetical protein [Nocardioides sp. LMS-CY]QWF22042.1 hypothetical protein KM427_24620 [Nocardioides sp. LMS-CY]